jgi:hypothetical protein
MSRSQRGEERMSNKQQTAVEWLVEQFKEYDFADVKDTENYIIKMQSFVLTEKLEKAKEMEKEEIKIAYYNGTTDEIKTKDELLLDAEHYYNETYGDESNP